MRHGAGHQLVLALPPTGITCSICLERRSTLLANPCCEHAACEECWGAWALSQLPRCQERRKLRPRCFGYSCNQQIFGGVWRHICGQQQPLREFSDAMSTEVARLTRSWSPSLMFWQTASSELVCSICREPSFALLTNGECVHAACEHCWKGWAEASLPDCVTRRRVRPRCCGEGCRKPMTEELWSCMRACSAAVQVFAELMDREVPRLTLNVRRVLTWALSPADDGPVCPVCFEHRVALLTNADCEHAACEDCWKGWAEARLPNCAENRTVRPHCWGIGCRRPMMEDIWRHVQASSKSASDFGALADAEVARLRNTAGDRVLVLALGPSGLRCQICFEKCRALLRSSLHCRHAACEECWEAWVSSELPRFAPRQVLRAQCFGFDCCQPVHLDLWRHLRLRSTVVEAFAQVVDLTVGRLKLTADGVLQWAPLPSEPGPECPICRERFPALLANPQCEHAACERCWSGWTETHLPHCRGRRQADVRCIGEECQELVVPGIWSHTCTQSSSVRDLDRIFAKRRHLQANELYPPEVQVECPHAECLGLAYRGFDTLMCFFCEHQWESDTGGDAPPIMIGENLVSGLEMKQCPGCGEHIIKNGGCDHMTCRCGHEFWWTTLGPYRH